MTKTLDDYMNDPDIAKTREPWREDTRHTLDAKGQNKRYDF